MIPFILTALAGIVCGVVAMRIWQAQAARDPVGAAQTDAPRTAAGDAPRAQRTRLMLLGAGALALVGGGVLAFRPSDDPAAPTAGPAGPGAIGGAAGQNLDDVDTMIARLAKRLEENPQDGDGFRMLGWSYLMTNRPNLAVEPYRKAIALLPKDAAAHSGLGEALVALAGKKVTDEARKSFATALSLDPSEPRARYFMALHDAQNGRKQQALDAWIKLANGGPADAPWQADVRRDIAATAQELGVNVGAQLKPAAAPAAGSLPAGTEPPPLDAQTIARANSLPPAEQQAMIDGMVEGLAARLKTSPNDPAGWARLLRSRMVQGDTRRAADDLATARKALAGNAAGLAQVNAAARELAVPGA